MTGRSIAAGVNGLTRCCGNGLSGPVPVDHARRKARLRVHRLGEFHNFQGPRTVRQAADKAAFLQRRDQAGGCPISSADQAPLSSRQTRGAHHRAAPACMDEFQQVELFLRQHAFALPQGLSTFRLRSTHVLVLCQTSDGVIMSDRDDLEHGHRAALSRHAAAGRRGSSPPPARSKGRCLGARKTCHITVAAQARPHIVFARPVGPE